MSLAMGNLKSEIYIPADPYPWPYNGRLSARNTALLIIDMQHDFCGVGGYVDQLGCDISMTRAAIEPIQRVLAAMRTRAFMSFTRVRAIDLICRICLQQTVALQEGRCRHWG